EAPRSSGPWLMGGLYQEKTGLLDGLGDLPGAPVMAAAAVLIVLAAVLGANRTASTSDAQKAASNQELVGIRQQLDSMSVVVGRLSDSLKRVTSSIAPQTAVAKSPPASRRASAPVASKVSASRAPARSTAPDVSIPPPPILESAQAPEKQ